MYANAQIAHSGKKTNAVKVYIYLKKPKFIFYNIIFEIFKSLRIHLIRNVDLVKNVIKLKVFIVKIMFVNARI